MRFAVADFRNASLTVIWRPLLCGACTALALIALPGCGSSHKSVVVAKDLMPEDVARRAMDLYDANKDGKIDLQEAEKCPALQSAAPRIDANKDNAISADEIAARFREYQSQSDLLPLTVRVERGKSPLSNAEVILEPEPFMGEDLLSFKGVSDALGTVALKGEGFDLPGVPLGLYRVRISGPADAELGCEVAEDAPNGGRLVFSF
jgi:hypothetical protein